MLKNAFYLFSHLRSAAVGAALLFALPAFAQMTITGTSEAGRLLFYSPAISTNGLSCAHCHADFDEETYNDGLIRAGHSLFNAYYRTTWWGKDPEAPDAYATIDEAAVVCVLHYMRNKDKLTAQQQLRFKGLFKSDLSACPAHALSTGTGSRPHGRIQRI